MAIPILQKIDNALADIFVGGSALARGAAGLSGFVPALRKLGVKAAVFNALADRIEAAVTEATPEALMEAQLLVHSLRYTQGATSKGAGAYDEVRYAGNPLKTKEYPYLELENLISRIKRPGRSSGLKRELERMVEDGSYDDVRFFHAYCKAVRLSSREAAEYIRDTIIPKLGSKIAGYVWGNFSPDGCNVKWFLRYLAENTQVDIVDMARSALEESTDSAAEIIEVLGAYPDGGEEIVAQFAENDDSDILCAVVHAFSQMAELAKWDDAKFESRIAPFAQNENSDVMDAALEEILKRKKPVLDNAAFIDLAASYTKSAKALEAVAAVDASSLDPDGLAAYEKAVLAFAGNQDDWSIRRDAVDLLVPFAKAHWNVEKSGPIFAKFCEDNDSDVRYSGLNGLVKTCASAWDAKTYAAALCKIASGNYFSRGGIKVALDALIAEEPRLDAATYKDALKAFVKNDSAHVKAAQALLAYSRDHDDEKTYLETAKLYVKDKNSSLRQTVLDILIGASAKLDSAKCMTTFNVFTKDKDADIRRKTFEFLHQKIKSENALAQFETLIKTFSADADRTTRTRAFAVLADYGKDALDNAAYAKALSNFAADRSGLGKSALFALKDGLLTKAQSAEDAAPYEAALVVFAKSGGRSYGEGIDKTAITILIAFGKEHWEDKRYEETLKDLVENCRSSTRSAALDALLEHALAKWPQEEYQELSRAYFKDDDDDARRLSLKSLIASGKEVWGEEYASILTGFLDDYQSDICYTAAAELDKADLAVWETFQLEALKAEELNTVESLMVIPSAKVAAAVIDDARQILAANPDDKDKLWQLFNTLAARKEEAGIRFLDEVLSEEFFQNDSNGYNLKSVLKYLSVENTPLKNQVIAAIVARASNAGVDLSAYFQLLAGSRTLSKEEFFEQYQSLVCGDDGSDLISIYRPKHGPTPDAKKLWDRRWAAALLENNLSYATAALFIFDDDEETWEKLLDTALSFEKLYINDLNYGKPSEEEDTYADSLLARMFINKHPKAGCYYRRLLDARYPKHLLDEMLSRLVPEWDTISKG
jgi:hypothetical protein